MKFHLHIIKHKDKGINYDFGYRQLQMKWRRLFLYNNMRNWFMILPEYILTLRRESPNWSVDLMFEAKWCIIKALMCIKKLFMLI